MGNSTFSGIQIGDFAHLETSTDNEVEIHKIPRADGAILRQRGGGLKTMTIHGWVKKLSRKQLELYLDNLGAAFGSALGTLIVNGNSYTNCIFKRISPDSDHFKWSRFTIIFYKSG